MEGERRSERSRRIEIDQDVVLITSDGHELHAKLKDLSRDGFRVEHDGEDLEVGEIIEIRTRHSAARGQIHWVTAKEAGGTFAEG